MGWIGNLLSGTPRRGSPEATAAAGPDFVVIDVETATQHRRSICQIGIVGFRDGAEVFGEVRLVDPGCDFDPMNIQIHGISEAHVQGAGGFGEAHPWLLGRLNGAVVMSHSSFDPNALSQACDHHGLAPLDCRWVDTVTVARAAWPELRSHKLNLVADHLGLTFQHHDALEDARVAGQIFLHGCARLGLDLQGWLARESPAPQSRAVAISRAGGGEGPLSGHVVCMTGDFALAKAEMADKLAAAGAVVKTSVSKATTLLVLGRQDPSTFAGKAKSAKHIRAEELIAQGVALAVITEAQLLKMIAGS